VLVLEHFEILKKALWVNVFLWGISSVALTFIFKEYEQLLFLALIVLFKFHIGQGIVGLSRQ
jgi:hypothetical protein